MLATRLLLLLFKAVVIYLLILLSWYFVWSTTYLRLIGAVSSKLLPVILVDDYRVKSIQIMPDSDQSDGRKSQLRYTVRVAPNITNWIQFGTNDLTYPVVTFFTLVLVTPKIRWKKRAVMAGLGFLVLWFFYSILALFIFRIVDYQERTNLAHLGLIEDIFGIQRLAAWKQSGGIAILLGQIAPVAVWFAGIFGQIFRRPETQVGPAQKKGPLPV